MIDWSFDLFIHSFINYLINWLITKARNKFLEVIYQQ